MDSVHRKEKITNIVVYLERISMHTRKNFTNKNSHLLLIIILFSLLAGCAIQPTFDSALYSELEGKWSWKQGPWHGYFELKKTGNSYEGTLDDVFEGTYGDYIKDVELSENNIKFGTVL